MPWRFIAPRVVTTFPVTLIPRAMCVWICMSLEGLMSVTFGVEITHGT
jgi:hypothetical protein